VILLVKHVNGVWLLLLGVRNSLTVRRTIPNRVVGAWERAGHPARIRLLMNRDVFRLLSHSGKIKLLAT